MRSIGRLRYFVADALDEWRHSPGVNLVATATLMFAIFIAGLVVLVLANVAQSIVRLGNEAPVEVYLKDDVAESVRGDLIARLGKVPGIAEVRFVSKDESLRRFRESFGDLADLTADLGTNPLPASIEARLAPGLDSEEIAASVSRTLAGSDGIEEIRYDRAWLERVDALLRLARVGGAGLALLVFGAVAFVMANVLRLAVYARRDEIEIMLLVGASPGFVRGPFLVAGLFQGLAASLSSLFLVELLRRAALGWAGARPGEVLDLMAGRPLAFGLAVVLVAIGVMVGLLGSYFAVQGVRAD